MPVNSESSAPYATTSSVLDILDRYRNRGMQKPITNEVLGRSGVSDSLIPRTIQSLRTLDLIDDQGNPTDTLEGLRVSPESEYEQRMQEWLKAAYSDVFQYVDPANDDETKIRDAFRTYTPHGQQNRMVLLFIGLCVAAGLRPEQAKEPRKPRASSSAKTVKAASRNTPNTNRKKPPARTPGHSDLELPSALEGLMKSLPNEGAGWTEAQKSRFVSTFTAVLEYCFPIVEDEDLAPAGDADDGNN